MPAGRVNVTVIMKLNVPVMPGLPLNTFEFNCKPGGGVLIAHVYVPGGPSAALKLTEYGLEVFPLGSGDVFEMFRMPIENPAVAVCWDFRSITVTTNG